MNTRSGSIIAVLVCSLLPLCAGAAETDGPAALPSGTSVSIRLVSGLSSSAAHAGDTFSFRVTADVRSANAVIVPAGAQGLGEVVSVETAGRMGQTGRLNLRFDYVVAANGQKIQADRTLLVAQGKYRSGAASHKWGKGREAAISAQMPLSIVVDQTVNIQTVDQFANLGAAAG